MYAVIVAIIVAICTFVFVWRVLTPRTVDRLMEKRVKAYVDSVAEALKQNLRLYHEEEVYPIQQALQQYPATFKKIYDELDLLASDGQVPKKITRSSKVHLQDEEFILEKPPKLKGSALAQNPNRKPVESPLPPEGHTIVVGHTGSGKTNTLSIEILARMQLGHELHLVDTKNELAQIFENHIEVYDSSRIVELIRSKTQLAKDRMNMFAAAGRALKKPIRDIHQFNAATGKNLPIITIVVEELIVISNMIDADVLTDLYAMGRSSGIYIFALTQLMKADILPRECSVNLTSRVYMGQVDRIAMKCLFPGGIPKDILAHAEQHLGPAGHALLHTNGKWSCVKMPLVDEDALAELM